MRQQWTALILSGALICAMSVPALAAAPVESAAVSPVPPQPTRPRPATAATTPERPRN